MMVRRMHVIVLMLLLAAQVGCSSNPYTGRSQLVLLSDSQAHAMGVQSYQKILAESKISQDPKEVEPVMRVSKRIAAAADEIMRKQGDELFEWEFHVIKDDNTPNAFCLPGGKIAVYTGIFPAAHNEAGLAAIVGHEVAHAMARHGSERVSQGMLAQVGAVALGATLSLQEASPEMQQLAMGAYGAGATYGVMMPYSRSHEADADKLGLEIAARAGYDPREGPEVWKRMQSLYGDGPPEWLSTHPAPSSRIESLNELAPNYVSLYEKAPKAPHASDKLPAITPKQGAGGTKPGAGTSTLMAMHSNMSPSNINIRSGGLRVLARQGSAVPQVLEFTFQFSKPAYVYSVEVTGPGNFRQRWDGGVTVMGGKPAVLYFDYARDGRTRPARGTYTLTIQGAETGHPFTRKIQYAL